MIWRDAFDLPKRFREASPPLVTQVAIALAATLIAAGARGLLNLVVPGVVPYALIFPAVVGATLLGGTLAGGLTLAACQLLALYVVVPPTQSFAILNPADGVSLALTTVAEGLVLWATAAYRSAAYRVVDAETRRAEGLSLALREMDHRTKNNFQIASSVLRLQATRSGNAEVSDALKRAANRILSIAATHDNLAHSSTSLSYLNISRYLSVLCERIMESLTDDAVLNVELEECPVHRDVALNMGLILNELITNAIKHGPSDGFARIELSGRRAEDGGYVIELADNGPGMAEEYRPGGLGKRLVELLASKGGIRVDRLDGPGTRYRISAPVEPRGGRDS